MRKLYHFIASGSRRNLVGCTLVRSKECAIGEAYLAFEKQFKFSPETVEAYEIDGTLIRRASSDILAANLEIGEGARGATLIDDGIVFHVAFKSHDPAAIAHDMAAIEEESGAEQCSEALKIIMSGCNSLKKFKNICPTE